MPFVADQPDRLDRHLRLPLLLGIWKGFQQGWLAGFRNNRHRVCSARASHSLRNMQMSAPSKLARDGLRE